MTLIILAAAGVAYAFWRIQRATPTEPAPVTTCVAPLCATPANLRVSVGHEFYDLCSDHGLPLLTDGLNR